MRPVPRYSTPAPHKYQLSTAHTARQRYHPTMRLTYASFVRSQWKKLPPNPNVDLTGQTVVVTGSNTGLGLEAAKQFARLNPAHLVLAVRNLTKGEEALAGEHLGPSDP
jgi:NADPH:quinone reductase-like Zn-dependent oxidoreductase